MKFNSNTTNKHKPTVLVCLLILSTIISNILAGGISFSSTEITQILNSHNNYRKLENTSNMKTMTWNAALANEAKKWADKCQGSTLLNHNPTRQLNGNYFGENIYASSAKITDVTGAVKMWMSEKPNYDLKTGTCMQGKVCGHYTQVVWANSNQLGCAHYNCPNLRFPYGIVCDYLPGGNYIGQKPYVVVAKTASGGSLEDEIVENMLDEIKDQLMEEEGLSNNE